MTGNIYGWPWDHKPEHQDPFIYQGMSLLPVSKNQYVVASGNQCKVQTRTWGEVNDAGTNDNCRPTKKSVDHGPPIYVGTFEQYFDNNIGKEYALNSSRTLALLQYKNLIYWVAASSVGSAEPDKVVIVTLELRKPDMTAWDPASDQGDYLHELKRETLELDDSAHLQGSHAFLYGNDIYYIGKYNEGTEAIYKFTATNLGTSYFDFTNPTSTTYLNKPDGTHEGTLLGFGYTPGGYQACNSNNDTEPNTAKYIFAWSRDKGYGLVLSSADMGPSASTSINVASTVVTLDNNESSYYSVAVCPLPLSDLATYGTGSTVLVSYSNGNTHSTIKAYSTANERDKVVFSGGECSVLANKAYPALVNLMPLPETSNAQFINDEVNMTAKMMVYGSTYNMGIGDNAIMLYQLKPDTAGRDLIGNLVFKSKTGLTNGAPTSKDTGYNEWVQMAMMPIGIVYYPPIIFPTAPEFDTNGNPFSLGSYDEVVLDDTIMNELWSCKGYKSLDPDNFNKERYEWLFKEDQYEKSASPFETQYEQLTFFLKETEGKTHGWAMSRSTQTNFSRSTFGLEVSVQNELANKLNASGSTTSTTEFTIEKGENGWEDANTNAVMLYWLYNEDAVFRYIYSLKKSDNLDYTNPLYFSFNFYSKTPSIHGYSFNASKPGDRLPVAGIAPVPASWQVMAPDGKTAQTGVHLDENDKSVFDYPHLNFWNNVAQNQKNVYETTYYKLRTGPSIDTIAGVDMWTWAEQADEELSNESVQTGGVGFSLKGTGLFDKVPGELNYTQAESSSDIVSQSENISNEVGLGFNLTKQGSYSSTVKGIGKVKRVSCNYIPYFISEKHPRKDKNDWWVADVWRESGNPPPWVLYYKANVNPSNIESVRPQDI